jgi:hypothetical protein
MRHWEEKHMHRLFSFRFSVFVMLALAAAVNGGWKWTLPH